MKLIVDSIDRICIKEKNRTVALHQVLICAKSGHGKSLALERIIYSYWKAGFVIISLNDAKNLLELGFLGMPIELIQDYHKRALKEQNLEPITADIKVFHPFTFNIPKNKIPETNFFTFPITELSDSEIVFLLEDSEDRITREIIANAKNNLSEKDSLWEFIQKIELLTKRIQKSGYQEYPNQQLFGLDEPALGTLKNVDEIARSFNRFQTNLFLMPKNSESNLNIEKELFENQKTIKIFSTRFISDQKTKDFVVLMLLNQIVKNAYKSKHPILIVIDELKDLCPSGVDLGYKKVLSREIAKMLNTMFRANNIASISTSQSLSGLNKILLRTNSFTTTLIGSLTGETDLLNLKQIYGFDKEIINSIQNLDFNHFIIQGIPNLPVSVQENNQFFCLFSPFCHKEPNYNFDELFSKYYPEKMKSYSELINKMKTLKEQYIKKSMDVKLTKIKKEKEEQELKQKQKLQFTEMQKKVEELEKQKKETGKEATEKRNQEIFNLYLTGEYSQQDLAKKFNLGQSMINNILKKKKELDNEGQ